MDIFEDSAQRLSEVGISDVPSEILNIIWHGTNNEYLDAISALALDRPVELLLSHGPLFEEICGRWLSDIESDSLKVLTILASLLPVAPHLSEYVTKLLSERKECSLKALGLDPILGSPVLTDSRLHSVLLAFYRLIAFDHELFSTFIFPAQLQVLFNHSHRPIRYLAIRIFCSYLHVADATVTKSVESYLGKDSIHGEWEKLYIDYIFLSEWESKRLEELYLLLRRNGKSFESRDPSGSPWRRLVSEDFSKTTACVGGVLVPRLHGKPSKASSLIMTKTVYENLAIIARGCKSSHSLLVSGPAGSGKTVLIRYLANELGKIGSMLTLHLNEMADIKLLVGFHTTSASGESFEWKPGVLTKAVQEGRWILVENLDRAPVEIMSALLPLIERRELMVPNLGGYIQAAPGFKIFGTVRSFLNTRGQTMLPCANMIGFRHWQQVSFRMPPVDELAEIAGGLFPLLKSHLPKVMAVYGGLGGAVSNIDKSKTKSAIGVGRRIESNDLFRCCQRLEALLVVGGVKHSNQPISEAMSDNIFLEVVDSFLGHLPSGPIKDRLVGVVAQELHEPPESAAFKLTHRKPNFANADKILRVGRIRLAKGHSTDGIATRDRRSKNRPFAQTAHILRTLESISSAISSAQPCLLVGETGVGKTTFVQQLADLLGQKLVVANLSQQSVAGDLLGGFKPVNLKTLAVSMQDRFLDLFKITFSSRRNEGSLQKLEKAIAKGRWERVLAYWQEGLRKAEHIVGLMSSPEDHTNQEPKMKKRKIEGPRSAQLNAKWTAFASDVQIFQRHLARKGFAFSFVEGNIVKAARQGDWVLLDEINLASPDTLESIADLLSHELDAGPSILLSDTGDTQRIYAHKNFRIFGAMNPSTDVGKRDLPMSLRSRFTEIYVESPDRDRESLVSIAKSYLGNYDRLDSRAAFDIADLYSEIVKLAADNRLVDGADQRPHFSLRTLTRTLTYTEEISSTYGLRRALFEGFAMGFMTMLSQGSQSLVLPFIKNYILGDLINYEATMKQVPRQPQGGKRYRQFKHYWMEVGEFPEEEQPSYIITPFIERNLLNLVRATSTRRFPILLQGPTSSGKTSMVEYLAKISGNKFVRINNHEHTDLEEYLGTYVSDPDGTLKYQEGILIHALREGHWIVLDELNLAPTDVLEALNRLLDDNRELFVPETQEVVRPHPNFMLFATQNPPGFYGGRKPLSRAFRNRFLELHFEDIPEDELGIILHQRCQIPESWCGKIVEVYCELTHLRQRLRLFEARHSFATLRDLFRWAFREAGFREDLASNGLFLLAERVRTKDERLAVKSIIEDAMSNSLGKGVNTITTHGMGISLSEEQLYSRDALEKAAGSAQVFSQEIVWTKPARRLYILVAEALKNNEPVLLVGETGTGKTTICQVLAKLIGKHLHTVNAHQNLETSDLIGGQRPVRNRSQVQHDLARLLHMVLGEYDSPRPSLNDSLSDLLSKFDALPQAVLEKVPTESRTLISEHRGLANALFEWSDGSLIQAMRSGDLFLLDEISLAEDSVLERLNSVLEPSRTLFLAEKGSDREPVISSPGFQFLATMNPSGDYGKKELSPALRNRFTEIWVPPISDEDEILEIVESMLVPSKKVFSVPIVTFASWFAKNLDPGLVAMSLRQVLAWVRFINITHSLGPHPAIFHGAAMVYLDGLGAHPSAKTAPSQDSTRQQLQDCLAKLHEIFGFDVEALYYGDVDLSFEKNNLRLGPFTLHGNQASPELPNYTLQAPTAKRNALKLVRALQLEKPILLEGAPGVGKTSLVAALAESIGIPLTRINLSDQTDLVDLFGSDVPVEGADTGVFAWRDAPFLRAMQKGEWVLLDEMNLASQSVLEGLNACLDHRGEVYISELNQTFQRHPKFVVFATQNPHHQGGGRKGLPASFVDRFTVAYADTFSKEDLLTICSHVFPEVLPSLVDSLVQCTTSLASQVQRHHKISMQGGPFEFNLRDIMRWLHLFASPKTLLAAAQPHDFLDLLFLQRFRTTEDVENASQILKRFLPSPDVPDKTYICNESPTSFQVGYALLRKEEPLFPRSGSNASKGIVNFPIAESIMLCVQNKWPCLLVGASGCGKTNILEQLARLMGADLAVFPMNSDMDTMDLVGGYEQYDARKISASLTSRLKARVNGLMIQNVSLGKENSAELCYLKEALDAPLANIASNFSHLPRIIEQILEPEFGGFAAECQAILRSSANSNAPRFEWNDGFLIEALKKGKWLVLDNANLCSPSVLDRLNSLLESQGFLSVNEHRNPDGTSKVMHPHPSFRLFMTMDPRHGELSRAMRNRSIELFMPTNAKPSLRNDFRALYGGPSPRLRLFFHIDWNSIEDTYAEDVALTCFDHMSFSDLGLLTQLESQFGSGLFCLSSKTQIYLKAALNVYNTLHASSGTIVKAIQKSYASLSSDLGMQSDFGVMQVSLGLSIQPQACTDSLGFYVDNASIQQLSSLTHDCEGCANAEPKLSRICF